MKVAPYIILFVVLNASKHAVWAQDSTVFRSEEAVVVTATRQPIKKANIAVPILFITKKQIQQSGALKLNELLYEQTGMFITNGSGSRAVGGGIFGNGLQLQGMSAEHTLILIDGEPVNGRNGGVLDLSRLAVGNVQRIEIIKGPYSSLYGSDAMGGVVNVITEQTTTSQKHLALRAGSFATIDAVARVNYPFKKTTVALFGNYNSSNGYDLDKSTVEKTLDPYRNFSWQASIKHVLTNKSTLSISSRYFAGIQHSRYAIASPSINIVGSGATTDWANNIRYQYRRTPKTTHVLSMYYNRYSYKQQLDSVSNNRAYYNDFFTQQFLRFENINTFQVRPKWNTILGGGYTYQQVNTTRYANAQSQTAWHLFWQNEIKWQDKLNISAGLRFDYNSDYQPNIAPKLAFIYKASQKIKLFANAGAGFRAPDFRQLYLKYINAAADNYVLYGTQEFSLSNLEWQKSQGIISNILPAAYSIKPLKPEQNLGYNAGVHFTNQKNVKAEFALFRNDVSNLIQFIEIAKRFNGSSVFSYININNTYTQGVETNVFWQPTKKINISSGYQYLNSADKAILKKIKDELVYGRDAVGAPARLMKRGDYVGLQFRSKHVANIKLAYEANGWQPNIRLVYRSKWGVYDYDGNGFSNMDAEFATGFVQINVGVQKLWNKQWQTQIGINNITNYTDATNRVNVPGINYFITMQLNFNNHKK
jgi:outer membrane receptor for ferrienterochelin and colicins